MYPRFSAKTLNCKQTKPGSPKFRYELRRRRNNATMRPQASFFSLVSFLFWPARRPAPTYLPGKLASCAASSLALISFELWHQFKRCCEQIFRAEREMFKDALLKSFGEFSMSFQRALLSAFPCREGSLLGFKSE